MANTDGRDGTGGAMSAAPLFMPVSKTALFVLDAGQLVTGWRWPKRDWPGRRESNPRSPAPKAGARPLGDSPGRRSVLGVSPRGKGG